MAINPQHYGQNLKGRAIKTPAIRLSDADASTTTAYAELLMGTGVPSGGYGRDSSATMLYFREDASSVNAALYLTANGGTVWTALSSASVGSIADTGTYYTTDTIDGAFDALGAQIGGDDDASFNFTNGTGSLLTDDDAVYAALDKLDQGWVTLLSTANGKGASKVGVEDSGSYFAGSTVEAILATIGSRVPVQITDPGSSGAIPVAQSGCVPIVTAGAETRTLAIPAVVGQELTLYMKTDGGDCVVTVASAINQTGNNTITMDDAGDCIQLRAIYTGTALAWRVVVNDGAALSTV